MRSDARSVAAAVAAILLTAAPTATWGQHHPHGDSPPATEAESEGHGDSSHPGTGDGRTATTDPPGKHSMWMRGLAGGWALAAMGQVHPIVTAGAPGEEDLPIHDTEFYATQPTVMANVESPGSRLVLHATLNFEAWTQPGGEYTFGGWGEGYLDKRHPHTLLHEATLSLNLWDAPGGSASLTAGKGFAPYGTEDPMGRPVVKFPTNHHLSQILERWLVSGSYLARSGLSVEASVFGGAEPTDAYDLSNIDSFGDSFSARITQRFGGTAGTTAPWEASASWAHVEEVHHGARSETRLYNAALRHDGDYAFGSLYALVEGSRSDPEEGAGYWSLLGEARADLGRHRPYYRVELATRPEYEREGAPGSWSFYRYDHDSHAIGASRWLIHSLGYESELGIGGVIARPFAEIQYNRVDPERGDFQPLATFGDDRFWSVSAGFKLFFGGAGMRMGSYGVLDPMTAAMRGAGHAH